MLVRSRVMQRCDYCGRHIMAKEVMEFIDGAHRYKKCFECILFYHVPTLPGGVWISAYQLAADRALAERERAEYNPPHGTACIVP